MAYSLEEKGSLYSTDYRLYFSKLGNRLSILFQLTQSHVIIVEKEDRYISPIHDIPLCSDGTGSVFNMLVEIPRWTNAKMEVSVSIAKEVMTVDNR